MRVSVDPDGGGPAAPRSALVRCPSAKQANACAVLGDRTVLEGPPPRTPCSQLYGGPQTATLRGQVDGRRIDVALNRSDGCQIARWRLAQPLLKLAVKRT